MRQLGLKRGDRLIVFDRLSERLLGQLMKTPLEIEYQKGLTSLDDVSIKSMERMYHSKRTFLLFPILIDGRIAAFFRKPFSRIGLGKRSVLLYQGTTRMELEGYAKKKRWPFPRILRQADPLNALVKDFPSVRHAFGKALEILDRKF